jgi:GT2 family glycosyltransferase
MTDTGPKDKENKRREIDVVIPVYGALDLTLRCIRSVRANPQTTAFRLFVIDDASPDSAVGKALEVNSAEYNFTLIKNENNLGFPRTSNIGFGLSEVNDVVLMNSDVVVYGDWLDRLVSIPRLNSRIGTVTPLTNNGTICSYPNWLKNNTDTLEVSAEEIDSIASVVNHSQWVEAPTGVGFCMYFKRECLTEVGYFDEKAFGAGYGEENDFSQRAISLGWINAITPSVYVTHDGGSSFGASKKERISRAIKTIEGMHPNYSQAVSVFIKEDPLRAGRERIDAGRVKKRTQGKAVLMITHSLGGGTERHVQELSESLEASGTPVLLARPSRKNPEAFEIFDPGIEELPNRVSISVRSQPGIFVSKLKQLGVQHIHIHNLFGYPDITVDFLAEALEHSEIQYDFTVHDYQYWCPRINLVGVTGQYCGEPKPSSCQGCVDLLGGPFGRPVIWKWRKSYEKLLRGARKVFTPTADVAVRVKRHIPKLEPFVRPHEPEPTQLPIGQEAMLSTPRDKNPENADLSVGIIGHLAPHKGSQVLEEVANYCLYTNERVVFTLIGGTDLSPHISKLSNVKLGGKYNETELDTILQREDFDVIWFPAVSPETYSYTLSHALKTRSQIVAFDIGAISQRLRELQRGHLIDLRNVGKPGVILSELKAAHLKR